MIEQPTFGGCLPISSVSLPLLLLPYTDTCGLVFASLGYLNLPKSLQILSLHFEEVLTVPSYFACFFCFFLLVVWSSGV